MKARINSYDSQVIAPHPQPLPALREGRQSIALAGWGDSGLISNQADMI